MKIRLLGQGYEVFTGAFGSTEFVEGVSVDDVSAAEARFFASLMSVENADGSGDPGDNAKFQASLTLEAVSVTLPTLSEVQARQAAEAPVAVGSTVAAVITTTHTQESLEEVADKSGIGGLREIADPLEVKATSITKLIAGILAVQGGTQVAETTE